MSYFHRCAADSDPQKLLEPENQYSTPWGSADHGPCDKCGRSGEVEYRCRSCLERGAEPGCPACGGAVSSQGVGPTCEGNGEITRTKRRGISVFPTLYGLLRYLAERDTELADDDVVVELEGERSDDLDLDADSGAMLVHPARIVAVHEVESERYDEVRRRVPRAE